MGPCISLSFSALYSSVLIFYFLSLTQEIGIFTVIFHGLKSDYMDKSLLSYGLSDLSVAWLLKDLRSAFKPDGLEKWFSEKGRSKGVCGSHLNVSMGW